MKYKITLNNRVYEVEVEAGKAMLLDEYEVVAPAAPSAPVLDLVTEQDVNDAIRANRVEVLCTPRAIVTPAAWDRSAATGLTIRRV